MCKVVRREKLVVERRIDFFKYLMVNASQIRIVLKDADEILIKCFSNRFGNLSD